MQATEKEEAKGFSKRQYSTSLTGFKPSSQTITTTKPTLNRRTDHTDDLHSEVTNSQINLQMRPTIPKEHTSTYANTDKTARWRKEQEKESQAYVPEELVEKERKVVELRERLKNIHHFYRVRIQEERNKNIERSEIFIGIIEELQMIQNAKVLNLQQSFAQIQEEQRSVGGVDSRIHNINKKIEEVIVKSQDIKSQNETIEAEISKRRERCEQKSRDLDEAREQLYNLRQKLQQFEKLKLKQNRRGKDLLQMISQTVG